MFSKKFNAILSFPKGKLKDNKGRSTRIIEFVIKVDLNDEIAEALDKDAKAAIKGLQKRGLAKVEIPFDSVGANIKLINGAKEVTIKGAHGVKIVAKANMNDADAEAIADIHWRIPYDVDTWQYLGENFGNTVSVRITNRQTVMTFAEQKSKEADAGGDTEDGDDDDGEPGNVTPINAGHKPAS